MKQIILISSMLLLVLNGSAWAGPVTKINGLTPKYDSEEVEITWATVLDGGCNQSSLAMTNPAALNHKTLVAILLAAFASGSDVEVIFGGGCTASGKNWIQTVKLVR